jgi:hypothetical protein
MDLLIEVRLEACSKTDPRDAYMEENGWMNTGTHTQACAKAIGQIYSAHGRH